MGDGKIIWIPKAEMNVTICEGEVSVSETMVMQPQPIKKPHGFAKEEKHG